MSRKVLWQLFMALINAWAIYFLWRALSTFNRTTFSEMVCICLYLMVSRNLSTVIVARRSLDSALVTPVHVLAILILKQQSIIPIALGFCLYYGPIYWREIKESAVDYVDALVIINRYFMACFYMVPILHFSSSLYQKLGGVDFHSISELPFWAFLAMISFEYLLEKLTVVILALLVDPKMVWVVIRAYISVEFFFVPLAIPLYLIYQYAGVKILILLLFPISGILLIARFLIRQSDEKQNFLDLLNVANDLIATSMDLDELVRKIIQRLQAIFMRLDIAELFLKTSGGWKLKEHSGSSLWREVQPPSEFFEEIEKLLPVAPIGFPGSFSKDELGFFYSVYRKSGFPSVMLIPLHSKEESFGFIVCASLLEGTFSSEQVAFAKVLVGQLSSALEAAKLHAELGATLKELRVTQVQLVQSEKMAGLGKLVAGVAHEMNNPLNFFSLQLPFVQERVSRLKNLIETYEAFEPGLSKEDQSLLAELKENLGTKEIDSSLQKSFSSLQEGTKRLKQIIDNLRTFARTENLQESWDWVDLQEAIDSTLMILAPNYEGRITLHKEYESISKVWCNAPQINQVFMNLLANAFDAVEGEGEVLISVHSSNGKVVIVIKDSGKGIPEEIRGRIFEPFFTTKEVGKGTGLGLSIVYSIIKQHNGSIEVESQENHGTTVMISLPIEDKKE